MIRVCPKPPELERGYFTRDPDVEAHARSCASCGDAWQKIETLEELGRAIRVPVDHDRRERVRNRLLAAPLPARRKPRWPIFAGAAIAAAVSAAALLIDRPQEAVQPLAILRARITELARSQYWAVGAQPDEVVRLMDGALSFDVDPLEAGERFRVVVGDAEVEVHGTTFDVVATNDRLQEVEVLGGVVEVRYDGRSILLDEGERWERPKPEVLHAAPAPRPKVKAKPAAAPAIAANRDREAYEAGWTALKAGSFAGAALSFRTVLQQSQDEALREDASYFLGVSLARAGKNEAAIDQFEIFLSQHARSARAGEAAAMLGWLHFDRGERDRAQVLFQIAATSSAARARQSGKSGLEAIRRAR